jgi:hypothetical protein
MPLGDIKIRTLSAEEARWRNKWLELQFPRDIPQLWRMSRKEYFAFMYALDPRMALIMSQEPGYREVLAYQRDKGFLQEFRDYVWRKLYDR